MEETFKDGASAPFFFLDILAHLQSLKVEQWVTGISAFGTAA
jgi:hypothetical protein